MSDSIATFNRYKLEEQNEGVGVGAFNPTFWMFSGAGGGSITAGNLSYITIASGNSAFTGFFAREVDDAKSPEREFNELADQWKRQTRHFSITYRRYANPAYKAILAKKEKAVPFILKELRRDPDRWFDALEELTNENPAKDAKSFYEAVDCWISWGFANGHLG